MTSTKRFWSGCMIALLINAVLLFTTAYAENEWFNRSLIFTFLIYCFCLAVLSVVFVSKNVWDGVTTLFSLLSSLLAVSFLFFVIFSITHNTSLLFILLAIGITGLNTLLLYRCFGVMLSLRVFIETGVTTIIAIAILTIPKGITDHYYGFSLMLSLWSLALSVLTLKHSR